MQPYAKPGLLTDEERFMFETFGYLVIPDALSAQETQASLEASKRAHAPYPGGMWRQLGHVYETEPAIEQLIDHASVIHKVRALMGDHFILHDRMGNNPDFLARTTPLRRALAGEWKRPEEPFGMGYAQLPFPEIE